MGITQSIEYVKNELKKTSDYITYLTNNDITKYTYNDVPLVTIGLILTTTAVLALITATESEAPAPNASILPGISVTPTSGGKRKTKSKNIKKSSTQKSKK